MRQALVAFTALCLASGSVEAREWFAERRVGTRLNFLFRFSYCGKELCLSFAHISHGSALGISDDEPNSGLNFLLLEYRYR